MEDICVAVKVTTSTKLDEVMGDIDEAEEEINSRKLDKVMEDIGVTEEVIRFRRHVHLLLETIISIMEKEVVLRIFGSQSEGSTTLGMKSDLDVLSYLKRFIAILPSYCGEVLDGCTMVLVINTATSLAQCCSLQLVKQDHDGKIVPVTIDNMHDSIKAKIGDKYIIDHLGRVLYSNRFSFNTLWPACEKFTHELEQHGPAITFESQRDNVMAIYCSSMPDECKVLLNKINQADHWLKPETRIKARTCGVYLVAPGNLSHTFAYDAVRSTVVMHVHYARDYSDSQWRMSTNLIERLLMFDLNIAQMKTFILTKMIRKELLKPIVGDRLSTFHLKTALFFTVETFPKDIWTKDNLVHCVLYCLITLRRFLKRRLCPHYTVSSVNLFYDKIQLYEFPNLIDALSEIINSQLKCIQKLHIDDIGDRYLASVGASSGISKSKVSNRNENVSLIITNLVILLLSMPMNQAFPVTYSKSIQMLKRHLHFCAENIETALKYGNDYPQELGFVLKHIYNALASMKASKRIAMKKPINEDIFKMFESSLSPSHITNYLKYAAMLVCTQQYTRAEAILQQVEGLISSDMIHVCAAQPDKLIQAEEINTTGVSSLSDIFMRHISKMLINVEFTAAEINCVPSHLWMYRTDTEEDCRVRELCESMAIRMTHVIVDAKPFLYYLKYMSSKVGRARLKPFIMLAAYITEKPDIVSSQGHIRTTLNMMGHILELENTIPQAWYTYKMSVKLFPWNNPAYWHLFRLLGNVVYGI